MNQKTNSFSINPTTMEEISDNTTGEFLYNSVISYAHLFTNSEYPWHWHNTIQFFRILDGEMDYILPSGTYHFQKGDIGFINCNILHMLKCCETNCCVFEEHLFSPYFIGGRAHSSITTKYVDPITGYPDFDIFCIPSEHPLYSQFERHLKTAHMLYRARKPFYEIYIHEEISLAWICFWQISESYRKNVSPKASNARLKRMLSYINDHFTENLTIPMIADEGMCSYRECSRVFHQQLHTTPLEYLTNLRLQYSCDLLAQTQYSITDIAFKSGFNSSSYFTKSFRLKFQITPREYRKKNQKEV